MITAKQARENARVPAQIKEIEEKIIEASELGEPGVHIYGNLSYPVISVLRDINGYDVSYDSQTCKTWIYWGH